MNLAHTCLLAVLGWAQQGPPPETSGEAAGETREPEGTAVSPPSSDEEWHDLDRVVQIVNEQMLTHVALVREMARLNRRKPFGNLGETHEAERQIRTDQVKRALRVQAGQDLGLDPAQVERRVKDFLERRQEILQGSAGMAAFLQERDLTLFEAQDQVKDQLYDEFWDSYVTGEGGLGDARQARDRYVRPGYLRYAYRQCLEHPELLPQVGGQAQAVILQQIFIDPQAAGGEEQGRALADDLRRRIAEGEDMGDLVERYGASKVRRGITEPLVESRLTQVDPAAGAFVAEAKPGDLSEPLAYKSKEGRAYWRIVRLIERTPALVPELSSSGVQKKLGERLQKDLSDWRREQAYRVLVQASYVWPADLVPQ